ncbi:MAG: DUF5671 domain-containing protein [Candidatus Falkowbacteria bacterium]|nr:DUF5671 domain-containing protein [Candidatus Falkowbacteria bacterium]
MNNQHNAKYAFYYLLSLVALIFTALSFGMIIFSIIDRIIPDVLNSYSNVDGQLKFAISALFIAAPIFYFMSGLINRGLHKGELEKDSGIRRWLTYFIILVSAMIILGVFIGVINNFLSGELTGRFIFKALTMLFISGVTFSFYFYDIKRENPDKADKIVKIFFFATLALVIAVFVAAWFFVESPKTARNRRLDQALVQNIYNIENAMNSYYDRNKKLPANLEEFKAGNDFYMNASALVDPETKAPIAYNKISDKEFELCATFRTDSIAEAVKNSSTAYIGPDMNNKEHLAGYQCLRGNLYSAKTIEALPIRL